MSLETATYINGLVATNPPGSDPLSDADGHLRLLKSTIKTTFPNVTGAVTPTHTQLNNIVNAVQKDGSVSMTGALTLSGDPTSDLHAVPKQYVDGKFADGFVTTSKIADANVTLAKLDSNIAGNGPVFSATNNTSQTMSNATWTKINLNTVEFDTATCFSSSRFTPTVAGYYQIDGQYNTSGAATTGHAIAAIYKNGTAFKYGSVSPNNGSVGGGSSVAAIVFLNGSTDYVELYGYQNSGSTLATNPNNRTATTYFSGALVRNG